MKRVIAILGVLAVTVLGSSCADNFDPFGWLNPEFDEGLNLEDLNGTVRIGANEAVHVGAIYVGLFSGTENAAGYPLPIVAPGTQDAFPYGGTMIGAFEARDGEGIRRPIDGEDWLSLVCKNVSQRQFYCEGSGLPADPNCDHPGDTGVFLHDFTIRQFPFYSGTQVWAFADNNFTTCDGSSGLTNPDNSTIVYGTNIPDVINKPQNYVDIAQFTPAPLDESDAPKQYTIPDLVTGSPAILDSLPGHVEVTLDCWVDTGC